MALLLPRLSALRFIQFWKAMRGAPLALLALLPQLTLAQTQVPQPSNTGKSAAQTAVPQPPEKQAASSDAEPSDTTIRVNVKLVNVFSTVTNSSGAPVSTLKQEDFQLFEDGKPSCRCRSSSPSIQALALAPTRSSNLSRLDGSLMPSCVPLTASRSSSSA